VVSTLADRGLEPGRYSFTWSGRGDHGAPAAAGIYFVRLRGAGVKSQSVRLAVIR